MLLYDSASDASVISTICDCVVLEQQNTVRPFGYGHGHETRCICGVAVLDTNADSCEFSFTPTGNVAMTTDVMTGIVSNGGMFLFSCTQHVVDHGSERQTVVDFSGGALETMVTMEQQLK